MTVTETAPVEAPDSTSLREPVEEPEAGEDLVTEEVLVEEISIDGMCGVY
ncbi:MAG TPA: mycofactocin precursor MftA [Acidimicrobiales bacterium]|jgi:mycofactocin precursor|nr:mycofactocin precursor MftA [Acidimicrobiales bacterium]